MPDFSTHLIANPRGREYSYAVRIKGLPYLWTDGRATWTFPAASAIISGGLAKTDWAFDYKVDPREPLEVGSGINVSLVDEISRRTRYLFSPERKGESSYLLNTSSPGIAPNTTSVDVADGSVFTINQDAYLGLETVKITGIASNTLTLERARYGSLARRHVYYTDGEETAERGIEITSQPTVIAGRYLDVYIGVMDNGVVTSYWKLWAGRLGQYFMTGRNIRLSVDPLNACLTKDEWPNALPGGTTNSDKVMVYLRREDYELYFDASIDTGTAVSTGNHVNIGLYAAGGTFNPLTPPTDGGTWYSLEQIAAILTDTLVKGLWDIGTSNNYDYLRNNIAIIATQTDGMYMLEYNNATRNTIMLGGTIIDKLNELSTWHQAHQINNWIMRNDGNGNFAKFYPSGYTFDTANDTALRYYPQNPAFLPDPLLFGCWHTEDAEMHAYVKVSDGTNIELVSFSGANLDTLGTANLAVEDRALVGTRRHNFGSGDELKNVNISTVSVVRTGSPMDASDVLLYLLTSIDGPTGLNGDYDVLGSGIGLGVPLDLVDVDGIRSKMRMGDMPKPAAYWSETGKGKESLKEFCKAHGVYFVTRRFERDGEYLFGLSVDVVDVPVATRFNITVNDSHLLADTSPEVDINERMLINNIKVTPRYEFDKGPGETGGERYVSAGDSIARYGRSKAFEISANAWFNVYSSLYGGSYSGEEAITTAIAAHVGIRWFGAYSDGNYTVELECPHVGWAFQAGDRAHLVLTGGVNPDGSDGFSNVAKIMDVKHTHGSRAGTKLSTRINTTRAVELAPCFRVTNIASNVLTIAANQFSDNFAQVPFPSQTGPVKDGHFFDRAQHGANFNVQLWEEGNFANRETATVTAVDLTAGTLTLSAPVAITIQANAKLYGTIPSYASTETSLNNSYAHIGTSEFKSLLDSGGAAEIEANQWI